jgi:hypothetical protein
MMIFLIFLSSLLSKEMDKLMMVRNELLEMLTDGSVDHTYNETVKQKGKWYFKARK